MGVTAERSDARESLRRLEGYQIQDVRDQEMLAPISERVAGRHEVLVRIPGDLAGGSFNPKRIVNPFSNELFGQDADAFDAEDEETESPSPAALDAEGGAGEG